MLKFWRARAANASVEFALVASLLLLPLFLGSSDFLAIISAQAQLNTALQSVYYFAYTNPESASNTTDVGYVVSLINSASLFKITLPATTNTGKANGLVSYGCFTPPSTTITYQAAQCSAGQTQQTLVTYQLSTTVTLPFPLPRIGSPLQLTATGMIQTQ